MIVTPTELIAIRRDANGILFVQDNGGHYQAMTLTQRGVTVEAIANKGTDGAALLEAMQLFWNKPVPVEEFRFITHSFSRPATWDGRTNGDPAASWAAEHGATQYDDVAYRWLNADGQPVAALDPVEGGAGSVWRDDGGSAIIQYNSGTTHWERADTGANVTSSRWSIVPYDDTKMLIGLATVVCPKDAAMPAALKYQVWAMGGQFLAQEFVYPSPLLIRLAANRRIDVGSAWECGYDYDTTVDPVIDARMGMRLDILLAGHIPVESASDCLACFIGRKVGSF